jgi:hypothetical protein
MQPQDITTPTACIVRFSTQEGPRPVHYEVVIDPRQKSPSGMLIRFDGQRGCEIHGWQPIDSFHIVEVLHEMTAEEFDAKVSGG